MWLWRRKVSRNLEAQTGTRSPEEYRRSACEDFACQLEDFICEAVQWYWECVIQWDLGRPYTNCVKTSIKTWDKRDKSWRQHHDPDRCAAVFIVSFVSTVLLSLHHVTDIVSLTVTCLDICRCAAYLIVSVLRSVARIRLVKTRNPSGRAAVKCKLCKSGVVLYCLYLSVIRRSCNQSVNKSNHPN
jgi:hypothetical protein